MNSTVLSQEVDRELAEKMDKSCEREIRREAFEQWQELGGGKKIERYAAHLLKTTINHPDVEDVVMDALHGAIKAIDRENYTFSGVGFTAYVKAIVKNIVRNEYRGVKPRPESLDFRTEQGFEDQMIFPDFEKPECRQQEEMIFLGLEKAEHRELIIRLLKVLPPHQREIFYLELDGMSFSAIAQLLGIKENTIRKMRYRAIHRMRDFYLTASNF